jgi:hypothetical protein
MAVALGVCACLLAAPGPSGATAAAGTAAGLRPTTTGTTPQPEQVQLSVTATSTSQPLPVGFLGFSIETAALHSYLGRDPSSLDPVFLQLLEGVDQGHAPVLRIGGDSTDDSWVALPGLIPPLAVNYVITNDWLATVRAMVQDTGTRLIMGISLAADDPQIAGVEARALVDGIGRHSIQALEIGNEPDLYLSLPWYYLADGSEFARRVGSYDFDDYIRDLNRWRRILPAGVPLAAGALALLVWLPQAASAVSADADVSTVTIHRYALSSCEQDKTAPDYATLANLLDSTSTEGLAGSLAPIAATLHDENRQLRVDELNSASCEGAPGVSDTFGSALWMLNVLFDFAAANVDGVNVHTLPFASYAPFSFNDDNGQWSATVNPDYYGMLMFASAFPTGAELLDTTDSSSDVKAYTTEAPDGELRTTIINENPAASADVTLELPGTPAEVSAETLTAPSLSATSGVELGGQSFGDTTTTGVLNRPSTSTLEANDGAFTLTVPSDSAVLLMGS